MMRKIKSLTLPSSRQLKRSMNPTRILVHHADSSQPSLPPVKETNHARNVPCVSINLADESVVKTATCLCVLTDLVSDMSTQKVLDTGYVNSVSDPDAQQSDQHTLTLFS